MNLGRVAVAVWLTCLLTLSGALKVSPALASYQGELYLDLQAPEAMLPTEVCLIGGNGVLFESAPECLDDGQKTRRLTLNVKADFGATSSARMSAKLTSYARGHVQVRYESERRPEVVTFADATATECKGANDGYHPVGAVNWVPVMGTRPVVLSVVPCRVDVEVEFPEYECLEGAKVDRRQPVAIDRQWQILTEESIDGCGANAQGAATFRFPEKTSIESLRTVSVVPIGMRIAWRPNALSEAPRARNGVQIEPDRSWTCDDAEWNDTQKRFEWSCGTSARAKRAPAKPPARLDFPTRLEMSVVGCAQAGPGCPGSWTSTVRYPGQVLTADIDPALRTLIVKWNGWCTEQPGRAKWTMDRITVIEVETTRGTKLSLFPPECTADGKGLAWSREPLPGLQLDEPLKVSFWGDRRFRSSTRRIDNCGSADDQPSPNCLELRPPEAGARTERHRLRRDGATVGVGIAGGLYGTRASAKTFYGPVGELHLNVLLRGLPTPRKGFVRLDGNLGGVVSFQSWSAYRCRGSCESGGSEELQTGNFERTERQRDSMLSARFQPALRIAASQDLFFGPHVFVGYGAPAIRRGGAEQVPPQVLWGGGFTVAWYISPAVAFEAQGTWTSSRVRFLTFDPSGIVSSVEERAGQWSGVFGLRFDDLAGD